MAKDRIYQVIIKCDGLVVFNGEMVGWKIMEVAKGYTVIIKRK